MATIGRADFGKNPLLAVILSIVSALALTPLWVPTPAAAQTVTPVATVATCAENIGAHEFACGGGSVATGTLGTAVGVQAVASDPATTAVGARAQAFGEESVAIGNDAGTQGFATNAANTAVGTSAGQAVNGKFNIAVGTAAADRVVGSNNTGIGLDAGFQVTGNANSALGQRAGAIVVGNNNTAIGLNAGNNIGAVGAPVSNTIAIGTSSTASQNGAIAIGMNAASTGTNAIAIGVGAIATGSVAVGVGASAANGGAAFGDGSVATATNSTAIGPGAAATHANAVAIGSGSVTSAPNTVSVGSVGGERRITNVAAGISSTDAVNVGQLSSIAGGFQSQLGGLQDQITDNRREARGGVALALAAGGLQFDHRPGKWSVAGAYGNFKGESGLAFGLGYAATDRLRFNATVSGAPQQGSVGAVVSGSFTLN